MAHHPSPKQSFTRRRSRSLFLAACLRTSNLFKELIEGGPAAYYLSPYYPLPDEGSLTSIEKQRSDPDQDRLKDGL